MRRMAIAITGLAMAALPAATASADDSSTLRDYSALRQQLKECNLDTNWSQLSDEARTDCNNLFRDYVLFNTDSVYYVHCRSSAKCIPTPDGMPAAPGPIPDNSTVYDVQPRPEPSKHAKAAAHKRRHRHRH